MSRVKFTAFADLHHAPKWFKNDGEKRLTQILQRAADSDSDFVVHLGDFCHIPSQEVEIIAQYHNFQRPVYHVLGNHEFDHDTLEEVMEAYCMQENYYSFDFNNFRFIALDNNYFSDYPGIYFHYSQRNYFDHSKTREYINMEQIEWFRNQVMSSPYPCVVMSHASLDYPDSIPNRELLLEIIRESQDKPGRVMLCINGHNHRNHLSVVDNVAYFDLNSASSDWLNKPHRFFPAEWYQQWECVGHQAFWEDALSAVITLDSEGNLKIEGGESTFVCGVTREMSGNPDIRFPCEPRVLSAEIKL